MMDFFFSTNSSEGLLPVNLPNVGKIDMYTVFIFEDKPLLGYL